MISIDTEADWFSDKNLTYENMEELYPLSNLFMKYGISPTYLVTYDVAENENCRKIISEVYKNTDCEIGSHSHSWTTPPFVEEGVNENHSGVTKKLLLELDDDILYKKLNNLHSIITDIFGIEPKSHRAGRWGIGVRTMQWLEDNGYLCDSSIVPIVNPFKTIPEFYKLGKERSKAPNYPYFPSKNNLIISTKENSYRILEIPLTGIKGNVLLNNYYFKGKNYLKKIFGYLKIKNYSDMSFRPSISVDLFTFGKITRNLFENGPDIINFMFHSSELKLGCSPYSDNNEKTKLIWDKIETVLKISKEYNISSMTLKECSEKIIKEAK